MVINNVFEVRWASEFSCPCLNIIRGMYVFSYSNFVVYTFQIFYLHNFHRRLASRVSLHSSHIIYHWCFFSFYFSHSKKLIRGVFQGPRSVLVLPISRRPFACISKWQQVIPSARSFFFEIKHWIRYWNSFTRLCGKVVRVHIQVLKVTEVFTHLLVSFCRITYYWRKFAYRAFRYEYIG